MNIIELEAHVVIEISKASYHLPFMIGMSAVDVLVDEDDSLSVQMDATVTLCGKRYVHHMVFAKYYDEIGFEGVNGDIFPITEESLLSALYTDLFCKETGLEF